MARVIFNKSVAVRALWGWGLPEGQGMPRLAGPGLAAGVLSHHHIQGAGQAEAAPALGIRNLLGASPGCQPVGEGEDQARGGEPAVGWPGSAGPTAG